MKRRTSARLLGGVVAASLATMAQAQSATATLAAPGAPIACGVISKS